MSRCTILELKILWSYEGDQNQLQLHHHDHVLCTSNRKSLSDDQPEQNNIITWTGSNCTVWSYSLSGSDWHLLCLPTSADGQFPLFMIFYWLFFSTWVLMINFLASRIVFGCSNKLSHVLQPNLKVLSAWLCCLSLPVGSGCQWGIQHSSRPAQVWIIYTRARRAQSRANWVWELSNPGSVGHWALSLQVLCPCGPGGASGQAAAWRAAAAGGHCLSSNLH
jgi:hypothetical protein